MKSPITTHVLDTSAGRPAAGIAVRLSRREGEAWFELGRSVTDADGRVMDGLIDPSDYKGGHHRLSFEVAAYFESHAVEAFYPNVTIDFVVDANEAHYHVPLLLNPFGYSTYRGS